MATTLRLFPLAAGRVVASVPANGIEPRSSLCVRSPWMAVRNGWVAEGLPTAKD